MDLSVYINELLGLQGEVTVPGIGHFTQVRINGYYNEKENKFYPPTHKVNFEHVTSDDESLAKYISDKKNISLASSRYFIEKYVTGLKQQLTNKKVEITGLGYVYTNGAVLAFSADNLSTISSDPSFFGLKPVDLAAHEEKPVVNFAPAPVIPKEDQPIVHTAPGEESGMELVNDKIPPPPVVVPREEKVTEPPPILEDTYVAPIVEDVTPPPSPPKPTVIEETEVQEEPEDEYEEPVQRNRSSIWVILLLVVIILLLVVLGLYKYKPEWVNQFREKNQTFVAVPDTAKKAVDTTKTMTKQDSAVEAAKLASSAAVDTDAVVHYELQAGAFKTLSRAEIVMQGYEKFGLHPRLMKHTPGTLYKITLGTYFDHDQGKRIEDSVKNIPNISKSDISLQPYNPKK